MQKLRAENYVLIFLIDTMSKNLLHIIIKINMLFKIITIQTIRNISKSNINFQVYIQSNVYMMRI